MKHVSSMLLHGVTIVFEPASFTLPGALAVWLLRLDMGFLHLTSFAKHGVSGSSYLVSLCWSETFCLHGLVGYLDALVFFTGQRLVPSQYEYLSMISTSSTG